MIVEFPLIAAGEIASEFRPGESVTVKATMRRLRAEGLISEGVASHPRGATGRVSGALHLYSALNLDAARVARSGEIALARRLAKSARRVEGRRPVAEIVRGLAGLGDRPELASLRRLFEAGASRDEGFRKALRDAAIDTEAERNKLAHSHVLEAPQIAYVVKLHGAVADLKLARFEGTVPLPLSELDALDSAFVGAALALRWEHFGPGQTLIKAAPALSLEEDGSGEGKIYPYERPLPEAAMPIMLAGALAGGPTVRAPRPVRVAGRR